jgi:hypothetical protein
MGSDEGAGEAGEETEDATEEDLAGIFDFEDDGDDVFAALDLLHDEENEAEGNFSSQGG